MTGIGAEGGEFVVNMVEEASNSSLWSLEEEKAFENALANYADDDDRWEKIAEDVPGKSVNEILHHFQLLEEDVDAIESGLIPLPIYPSLKAATESTINGGCSKRSWLGNGLDSCKGSRLEMDRRKGISWTEEEHRLFLLGLEKYGKGDWRSISRNFVVTRTPTQVASHAQKFFIRLNSGNKDRRRPSIHDITMVGHGDSPAKPQTNAAISTSGNCSTESFPPSAKSSGAVVYGTAMGHPVVGGLIPALGTPVTMPAHRACQMSYRAQPPATPATSLAADSVSCPNRSRPLRRKFTRR